MKDLTYGIRVSGTCALQSTCSTEEYFKCEVSRTLDEIWEDPRRPEIKPDRHYYIEIYLREDPS